MVAVPVFVFRNICEEDLNEVQINSIFKAKAIILLANISLSTY